MEVTSNEQQIEIYNNVFMFSNLKCDYLFLNIVTAPLYTLSFVASFI